MWLIVFMRPRYNTAPVPREKIQLIQDMLNDPTVGELWQIYIQMGQPQNGASSALLKAREKAWNHYCIARDKFLGLPPLVVPSMQGTINRYRM